jgi:hypothetical protein
MRARWIAVVRTRICKVVAAHTMRSIAAECARSRFRFASMERALACSDTAAAVSCAVHCTICALRCCSF